MYSIISMVITLVLHVIVLCMIALRMIVLHVIILNMIELHVIAAFHNTTSEILTTIKKKSQV